MDSAILSLVNEQIAPLDGNHTDIANFSSRNDGNFIVISQFLAQMVSKICEDAQLESNR